MNPLIQSEHFTLHPLTEGVYAAIASEGGAGFSNAGIIDIVIKHWSLTHSSTLKQLKAYWKPVSN
jgi:hypothetical protein